MKSKLPFISLTGFLFFALLSGLACGETVIRRDQDSHIIVQPGIQPPKASNPITMFLCGDVMTGRGIDQVLPHPSDPVIHEPVVKTARGYVALAEMNILLPVLVSLTRLVTTDKTVLGSPYVS